MVCVCVCAACGSVCRVAAQCQSSHLLADRLEIEAVFAQLTPSHGQDKYTALYKYTHNVCHSPR